MFSDRQVLIYHFYNNGLIESEISKKTKISEQEVEKELNVVKGRIAMLESMIRNEEE